MDYNSPKNQEIKRKFVDREVIYCVSTLIYELSQYPEIQDELLSLFYSYDYETPARDEGWVEYNEVSSFSAIRANRESIKELSDINYIQLVDGKSSEISDAENWQELCNDECIEPKTDEIYEHWIVSEYLSEKLKAHGETVAEFKGLTIWGRGCTGQAILLDSVISEICSEMEILDGQKNDWGGAS